MQVRVTGREGKRKKEIQKELLSADSVSKQLQQVELGQAEVRDLFQVSHVGPSSSAFPGRLTDMD